MSTTDDARKMPSADGWATTVTPGGGTLLNGRYLLIRQLSAGGFGTVHLAHDQQMHGRPVVVKIQIDQRVDDPWFERKFSEEVRALSLLDHPGVVVAFDSGRTPDGKPFLVMQYVDGVTLRTVMSPEGMPLERIGGILKQLGHALTAAHEKGIWHRDLKPENVMLQSSTDGMDRVRLIDFGIATVADAQSKYSSTTRVAGSIHYMAPEQSMGQPTASTDIYAMGLIAYEMITGRRPFPAENAIQMITLQQLPVRVKPSDLRPSLPPATEQLILQSLDVNPAKRPQSAREFGERLQETMRGSAVFPPFPAAASGTTNQPPPLTPARRQRWPLWLVTSVVAAGAGGYGIYRAGSKPAVPPVAPAPPQSNAVPPAPAQAELPAEKVETPEKKPAVAAPPAKPAANPPLQKAVVPRPPDENGTNFRRLLPPPREQLDRATYHGPIEGEIHWTGKVLNNGGLMIRGGQVNTGAITGDLPRVPVTIELVSDQATLTVRPIPHNQWDHIAVRNLSGRPLTSFVVRWKVK